jgi:tetratricopeptide (TPR) repeat protein
MKLLPFFFTVTLMTSALASDIVAVQAGEQAGVTDELFSRADGLAAKGEFDAAIAATEEVVARHPDSSLAHQRLGGMLLLKGDYSRAIDSFRTSIGLDERNGRAFIGMGMAYIHIGSYTLARASFDEALGRQPELAGEINKVTAWLDERDSQVTRDRQQVHAGQQHPSTEKPDLPEPESIQQTPAKTTD